MGHPRVATVRVVLDDEEAPARPDRRGESTDGLDLSLARNEMEAVRGNDSVEGREVERTHEVGDAGFNAFPVRDAASSPQADSGTRIEAEAPTGTAELYHTQE